MFFPPLVRVEDPAQNSIKLANSYKHFIFKSYEKPSILITVYGLLVQHLVLSWIQLHLSHNPKSESVQSLISPFKNLAQCKEIKTLLGL